MTDSLGFWIVCAVLIGFALVLVSRYLHRDSSVKSTKFGIYIERQRYDEEFEEQKTWPHQEKRGPYDE